MRIFLVGVGVGVAVVLLATLALVQQISGVAVAAPPSATATASAQASAVSAQIAAVSRALSQAQQSRKAVPVTLTFTERDLTASASSYFPQTISGVNLSDPVVHVRGGQLELDTTASAAFLRATAAVVATGSVVNGRVATTIVSATIAGAPLPQSVTSDIKTQLDAALGAGLPAKFQVTSLTTGDGTLTVTGIANP